MDHILRFISVVIGMIIVTFVVVDCRKKCCCEIFFCMLFSV